MIGKLKGVLDSSGPDWVIVDVGGVGYHVFCSAKTITALPGVGEPVVLHTDMLVSESSIRLVGFATAGEREWFRLLDGVQGVGTKVALAVLSTLSVRELSDAVALSDKAMIARSPGVGPKVAQRIVSELKDRVPALAAAAPAPASLAGALEAADGAASDAISALVNLGYNRMQAGTAVAAARRKAGDAAPTETLIRHALKELSQ